MKNQIGVIVMVIICLGLGVALIAVKKQSTNQKNRDGETIVTLSNNVAKAASDLEDQKKVNTNLEKDVETQKKSYGELTNQFTQVSANLAKSEADVKTKQEEITKRDAKIAELEVQNQALDKQAQDLSTSITNLTLEIAATQKKLAASEGDKAFLQTELKRMIAEKQELERQFNDLAVLRAQVSKLKEQLAINRRMEWNQKGLTASGDEKGAQRLMTGSTAPTAKAPRPNYDLNVEVKADGSVKVISPLTNNPSATPAPNK